MRDSIRIEKDHMVARLQRDDASTERFLEILRNFKPQSTKDISGYLGGGLGHDSYSARIYLLEDYRNIGFDESSIVMDLTLYTGEEGCLAELIQIYEDAPKIDYSSAYDE